MAENTYTVGYSTNARAKCKYSGCGESIEKDDIRFSKSSASAFSERPKSEFYHAKCMFMSFVRARKTTKKIESMNDIEGLDSLKAVDKDNIKKLLKEWKSGSMKDQVPKITRKRKADGDDDADDKKKKTRKEPAKSSKKTTRKTKDSDEEEEEEDEYKPKKSRKVTKLDEDEEEPKKKSHLISKKTETKKPKEDSDDDEPDEEDEDDEKFNRILKGKSASSNQKKEIDLDSDKSEDEKKAPPPKQQPPPKTTNKKRKSESDEEVKESESSAEDEEENSDKFLSGKIIATIGKLSMPREKIIELIEKNGGKYAKTITNNVTHVICAKKDDKTQKLQKAKELGKIIVTESFLKRGQ